VFVGPGVAVVYFSPGCIVVVVALESQLILGL
jgi:hypothetical protein